MTIIAYARFSSNSQKDGYSIERQFNDAKAYAASRGWQIDEFISDEAKSAFHGHNMAGQLGSIFARVKRGQLGEGDTIIVENLDRVSREKVTEAISSIMLLMMSGLTLITTHDGRVLTKANYDDEVGDMFDTLIKVRLANQESETKRKRQLANWDKWRAEGKLTFKAPFWMTKERVLIPERVAILKRMFDMTEAGFGCGYIAAKFLEDGIYSYGTSTEDRDKRARFTPATISTLLKNRSVLGEYQPKSKGQPVGPAKVDFYPQAISYDQFNRVQASIKTRQFRDYGSGKIASGNMLKSVLRCSRCRERMILGGRKLEVGYRCRLAALKDCDHRRMWNREKLDQAVLSVLREVGIKNQVPAQMKALREELAMTESRLVTSEANSKALMALFKEMPTSRTVKAEIEDEDRLHAGLTKRLEEIKKELSEIVNPTDAHYQALKLVEAYQSMTDEDEIREFRTQMNVLLHGLVQSMFVSPSGSLTFQLKDLTTYRLQYGLVDNPAPRKTGSRPLSDFEWRMTGRMEYSDIQNAINEAEANPDPELLAFLNS